MARRVFISYAQESDEHREAVRDLWVFLRQNGVDTKLDWEAAQRRQDWALWMGDQVREADVVLCVASEQYRKRAEGREGPDVGRGVQWEARLIRDAFHATQDDLSKFVPVVLPGQSTDGVPDFLAPSSSTVYFVEDFTIVGAEKLLRLLLDQPEVVEPELGPEPVLGRWEPANAVGSQGTALRHEVMVRIESTDEGMRAETSLAGTVLGLRTASIPSGLREWRQELDRLAGNRLAGLGRSLWEMLLDEPTGRRLVRLIDDSPLGTVVDVVVWLDEAVSWLPVELLRLPDGRLMATAPGVWVSRRLAGVERSATPALSGPLKILAAVAAPSETRTPNKPLDVEAEMQAVVDVMTDVDGLGGVSAQVRVLEVASLAEIGRALAADQYHVLHLSAHGSPEGVELEDEDGSPQFADAIRLVAALRAGERPLPLVVLSSCHGAAAGTAGLAAALVRNGADRVIAMQTSISDVFATDLTRELYRVLAAEPGMPVARALSAARRVAAEQRPQERSRRWDEVVPTLIRCGEDSPLRDPGLPEVPLSQVTLPGTGVGVRELPIGRLIGRRQEVRTATAVWRGRAQDRDRYGDAAGVVITGIGGIGKTAVAGRILARAREQGWMIAEHEGVWSPADLITGVANALLGKPGYESINAALRESARADEEKLRIVFGLLKQARLLVLFDDFEQNLSTDGGFLDEGFAEIFLLLCQATHVGKVLVTCRYPIPGTDDLLLRLDLPPLTPAEQGRLFLRLRSLRELSVEDRRVVTQTIGGHPRLIEFLDVLLRQRVSPADLRHVTAKLRNLTEGESPARPGRRTLADGISDVIRLGSRDILLDTLLTHLTADQRELALQTSIFHASASREDLAYLRYGDAPADDQITDLDQDIERLRDLTLLTTTPDDELLMHPWVGASLKRHHPEPDLISRHRRGAAMRLCRINSGRGRLDDFIDHLYHLAGQNDYDTLVIAAFEACEFVGGEVTVAALLAEAVPLLPTTHTDYLALAQRECIALQNIGLTTATAHKLQAIHATAHSRATADPGHAEYQRDLSISHNRLGDLAVALGDSAAAEQHYDASLKISERLAATDPDNAEYQRDLGLSHDKLGDLAVARGDSAAAEQHHNTSLKIAERLAATDPDNAEYQRDLSVSHNKLGDLAVTRGDSAAAEQHYDAARQIRERLAATDPDNAEYQRDLSISHNKLGDLAVTRGDSAAAEQHHNTSLKIAERLAATDPDNAEYQRDLSISHNKLGDLAVTRGDSAAAEQHYDASLKISERLAATDPGNAEYQRDLSISHNKLGDLAVARGDSAAAEQHHNAGLKIAERLAATDPGNAQYQRDLSVSHDRLGGLAVARGDSAAAEQHHNTSLKISERLAATHPGNAQYQRDLSISHDKLGGLAVTRGDSAAAEQHYDAARQIRERLAATHPDNAQYQRDLSISHDKLGDLAVTRGDSAAAEQHYDAARQIRERLAATDPDNAEYQRDLSTSHDRSSSIGIRVNVIDE